MKELSFEKMEEVNGGSYCQLICHWMSGGGGYQGDYWTLYSAWSANCRDYCQF